MKYNVEDEFDLNLIYQKLTSNSTPTVKANEFFTQPDELTLLQQKLEAMLRLRRAKSKSPR